MTPNTPSGFAPKLYAFHATAVALSYRQRRPADYSRTFGDVSVSTAGGRRTANGSVSFAETDGRLAAATWDVEVSADYADLAAAREATVSLPGAVSRFGENSLAVESVARVGVTGYQLVNVGPSENLMLEIDNFSFRLVARHDRQWESETAVTVDSLTIGEVRLAGKALRITTRHDIFSEWNTLAALRARHDADASFRAAFGHQFYRPASHSDPALYTRRGFALATVVNKIEWVNPADAIPGVEIAGHSIQWPGFGTIYLGELTVAADRKRLEMVRVTLGSPDGGESGGGSGEPNGHESP
ncbi:MAG: hypothetical protein IT162_08125 [Bryobacterales bacterium]|nr:hypothetical protein [Bryobacterales bacterium]